MTPFHGGASQADRIAEDHADRRRGPFRKLVLFHDGVPFLKRWALDVGPFGLYLHHVCGADPGKDLHDHPWPFVSIVLWGHYTDEWMPARQAPAAAQIAETLDTAGSVTHGVVRECPLWSVHRVKHIDAHRITHARPNTWTLILRGRKTRDWGFYPPDGYVSQRLYDYDTRRPVEVRGKDDS